MTTKRARAHKRNLSAADAHWIKTRQALLRRVKSEVRQRLGHDQRDITDFKVRYEKELRKRWTLSSQDELLAHVESANLVYGGDFHALAQAQRTHLRILRKVEGSVTLALECFHAKAQTHLDEFLTGRLTLDELRQKAKWDRTWGFSWEHYRPLLELARERGFRLLALNSSAGARELEIREAKAAKLIARAWNPKGLLYVLFGDLHLAPAHLPRKVQTELDKSKKRGLKALTIHLNSERVYFQLAQQRLETEIDVVKFSEQSFCVLSTPPWVKWQSYLLFLDRIGTPDGDERLDDETDFDPTDQVALLIRLAASDLGVAKDFKQINDLAVYGEDDESIWRVVDRRASREEREIAHALLRSGQRFFLPQGGIAYQPKPTINSAAALAGLYLHAKLSCQKRVLWRFPEDLRALVWIEAVSYLISKMINHSRRSETVAGLQAKLQKTKRQESKLQNNSENAEALRLALDVRLSELVRLQTGRVRPLQIRPRRTSSYVEASRILGGMLGERLYVAYRSRKLSRAMLMTWLKVDPGSRTFQNAYAGWIERVTNWTSEPKAAVEGI